MAYGPTQNKQHHIHTIQTINYFSEKHNIHSKFKLCDATAIVSVTKEFNRPGNAFDVETQGGTQVTRGIGDVPRNRVPFSPSGK